ncbi:MAG TPA: diacylglycerol kinase family lipid kinase [Clostridiales bacterium]|nr:diacylglycerol kinase family lipid kinase [Clostridiales bacterium]
MRYVFIINPAAGKGKAKQTVLPLISSYFNNHKGSYKIYITQKKGDATEIAKSEASLGGEAYIFACGGEGTTFEVLNGIVGYPNVSLGIIPCGSANDFVKYFGNTDVFFNIEHQIKGTPFPVDIIKAGEYYALNQCSVGMDAMVAQNMNRFKGIKGVSGSMAYGLAIVYTFFEKYNLSLDIKIDNGQTHRTHCLFAVCANAPYYGGGYKSAPFAIPGDGKLDYSIIETKSRIRVVSLLGLYRKGMHINLKICKWGNCESMEISAGRTFPLNLDGEIFYSDRIKFEILKKGIKFIVPSCLAEKFDDQLKRKRIGHAAIPNPLPVCETRE